MIATQIQCQEYASHILHIFNKEEALQKRLNKTNSTKKYIHLLVTYRHYYIQITDLIYNQEVCFDRLFMRR